MTEERRNKVVGHELCFGWKISEMCQNKRVKKTKDIRTRGVKPQDPDTRAARVKAALKDLQRIGAAFSVADVAERAGISRATLYRCADLRALVGAKGDGPRTVEAALHEKLTAKHEACQGQNARSAASTGRCRSRLGGDAGPGAHCRTKTRRVRTPRGGSRCPCTQRSPWLSRRDCHQAGAGRDAPRPPRSRPRSTPGLVCSRCGYCSSRNGTSQNAQCTGGVRGPSVQEIFS